MRIVLLGVVVLLISSSAAAHPLEYRKGEVLVVESGPGIEVDRAGRASPVDAGLSAVLAQQGIQHISSIGPERGASSIRFLRLTSDRPDFDPLAAAQALRATGRFRAVSPNYELRLFITIPNDPYVILRQWYIQAPNDADIDLPEAWDIEQGAASVVIGILDTGVDLGHPDLASKIWTNAGETPGNGLDDDGNGYIDDVNGWDFGNHDNDPNPHAIFDAETGIDLGFHGTFVAGIAAAATNNGEGIAGAGWNCTIMPLKGADAAGDLTLAAVSEAFQYAAANGVDVLNLSFGAPGDPGVPEYFQALVDLVTAADGVCVAAAGNDGSNALVYPAACHGVISVAAADRNNLRASFTNWGTWVDVAAPGAEMFSTICRNYEIDEFSQVFYLYLFGWDGESPYMYGDGTSFAAPLVAGTCALVRTRWPGMTALPMEAHMIATGDVVAYDLPMGKKVNALSAVTTPVSVTPAAPGASTGFVSCLPNPVRTRAALRFNVAGEGRASLRVYDSQGRVVRTLFDARLGPGVHTVEWDGSGDGARPLGSGVYFAKLASEGYAVTRRLVIVH